MPVTDPAGQQGSLRSLKWGPMGLARCWFFMTCVLRDAILRHEDGPCRPPVRQIKGLFHMLLDLLCFRREGEPLKKVFYNFWANRGTYGKSLDKIQPFGSKYLGARNQTCFMELFHTAHRFPTKCTFWIQKLFFSFSQIFNIFNLNNF